MKHLQTIILFLVLVTLILIAYALLRPARNRTQPGLHLSEDTLVYNTPELVTVPEYWLTNTDISNAVYKLAAYQTNIPWMVVSNNRIYSGVFERNWSAEFDTGTPRHFAGIVIGGGLYGVQYSYNPWRDLTVGGIVIYDNGSGNVSAAGTVGWRW